MLLSLTNVLLQALMPDGNRVVIIGGRVAQNISRDTITAEVYDHSQLESVSEHQLDFLYSVRNGRAIFPVSKSTLILTKMLVAYSVEGAAS